MVAVMQVHSHDAIVRNAQQLFFFVAVKFDDEQCDTVFGQTLPTLNEFQFRFDQR